MAESDFDFLLSGAAIGAIDRGVSGGIVRPNGGGNFIFGFNSLVNDEGSVGLHVNQTNFNPMTKGCRLQGAIRRGASGGNEDFALFFFVGLQGNDVDDNGYLFGLADDDPHNIVLRKGKVSNGLPNNAAGDPATLGTLLRSTEQFANDVWLHLRLDMIVNGTGDVILKCYENDLTANTVVSPVWVAISGMASFTDDSLGVNSGSAPYTSGRAGMAFWSKATTRRGYLDHVEVLRQL